MLREAKGKKAGKKVRNEPRFISYFAFFIGRSGTIRALARTPHRILIRIPRSGDKHPCGFDFARLVKMPINISSGRKSERIGKRRGGIYRARHKPRFEGEMSAFCFDKGGFMISRVAAFQAERLHTSGGHFEVSEEIYVLHESH